MRALVLGSVEEQLEDGPVPQWVLYGKENSLFSKLCTFWCVPLFWRLKELSGCQVWR
jgi:hypothetical protein